MTIEERLEVLEQKMAAFQVQGSEKAIRANAFIVEDENGKPRAELKVTKDRPRLILYDENGNDRAELDVAKGGPGLWLNDEKGELRASLVVAEDGPSLRLYDEDFNPRAWLGVIKSGPLLGLYDENFNHRAMLCTLKNGPRLILYDENGNDRAGLGATKDGPRLVLADEDGKAVWSAPGRAGAKEEGRLMTGSNSLEARKSPKQKSGSKDSKGKPIPWQKIREAISWPRSKTGSSRRNKPSQ